MDVYTTTSGDTWDSVAYKALGNGKLMDRMIAANQQYVDIFIFSAGIELVVPDIEDGAGESFPEWYQ